MCETRDPNIEEEAIPFKDRMELYNKRNEFVSKIWTSIAILSIFLILQTTEIFTTDATKNVEIPIIGLKVPADWALLITAGILSALILQWMETYSRIMFYTKTLFNPGEQKIKNAFVYSTPLAVSGQPNLLYKTEYRWIPYNNFAKFFSKIQAILLRILAISVNIGLPFLSLLSIYFYSFSDDTSNFLKFFIWAFSGIGLVSLVFGTITEIVYAFEAFKELFDASSKKSKKTESTKKKRLWRMFRKNQNEQNPGNVKKEAKRTECEECSESTKKKRLWRIIRRPLNKGGNQPN